MSNVLNRLVIKLNANWHAFEILSVRQAITMLCPEKKGDEGGFVMDFEVTTNENGEVIFASSPNPVTWDQWIQLPLRDCDEPLMTSRGAIRCPQVVLCANYRKLPLRVPNLSNEAILRRDGYTCQYTNEKLPRDLLNVDHVKARHIGGKDSWENMVACRRDINFKKGHQTNEEAGLKLIRTPKAPMPTTHILTVDDLPESIRDKVSLFTLN